MEVAAVLAVAVAAVAAAPTLAAEEWHAAAFLVAGWARAASLVPGCMVAAPVGAVLILTVPA